MSGPLLAGKCWRWGPVPLGDGRLRARDSAGWRGGVLADESPETAINSLTSAPGYASGPAARHLAQRQTLAYGKSSPIAYLCRHVFSIPVTERYSGIRYAFSMYTKRPPFLTLNWLR